MSTFQSGSSPPIPSNTAIEFLCGTCSRMLKVPTQAAGKQAKCPQCGAVQIVPSPPAPNRNPLSAAVPMGNTASTVPPAGADLTAVPAAMAPPNSFQIAPPRSAMPGPMSLRESLNTQRL